MSCIRAVLAMLLAGVLCLFADVRDPYVDAGGDYDE